MRKGLAYLVFCLSLVSCDTHEKRYEYLSDGKTIKSVTEYQNDLKGGIETMYFSNENVSSITTWENGRKNGLFKEFYPNGNIELLLNYHNDLVVGEAFFYRNSGEIVRIQYYDSLGKVTDFKEFNRDGSRSKKMFPIYWIDRDSVNMGDAINISLRIGNVDDFRFLQGVFIRTSDFIFDENNNPINVTDTLEIIHTNQNFYPLQFPANTKGLNFFRGQILVKVNEDSLARFSVAYPYYVK